MARLSWRLPVQTGPRASRVGKPMCMALRLSSRAMLPSAGLACCACRRARLLMLPRPLEAGLHAPARKSWMVPCWKRACTCPAAPLATASMSKGFGSTPLLSDDEMEKQYSSVYQRAKARRSSVGAGTFVSWPGMQHGLHE